MQPYLSVSMSDMQHNAATAVSAVGVPVIAVVKMNGYGVGVQNAVNAWRDAGIKDFAVSEPCEALALRGILGDDESLLLLSPVYNEATAKELVISGVIMTVTSADNARMLSNIAKESGASVRAHVKVDVGMGRFGQKHTEYDDIRKIYDIENVDFCGIFAHFPLSFEREYNFTLAQLGAFTALCDRLTADGVSVGIRHIANSVAALCYPETRLDAVRLGSALVGRLMKNTPYDFRRVGRIVAPVADVRTLSKGDTSGYAMIYKAKRDVKCAIVELGFSHGYMIERASDNFRFVDLLRNLLHTLKNHNKCGCVYDENGGTHRQIGRTGNQFTLFDNSSGTLSPGDKIYTDVNLLLVDSSLERVIE